MASNLSASELKKSLGSPPVLDLSGLSKALEKYTQLAGKGDFEDEVPALGAIGDLAISGKQKVKDAIKKEEKVDKKEQKRDLIAKLSKLGDFLDELIKEAQTAKKEAAAEAEKEEEGYSPARGLIRARKAGPEAPMYFVVALGKLSGVIVVRKLNASSRKKAKEARTANNGKKVGGKVLLGRCYGDSGKIVFDIGITPEETVKPPGGLASNLRKSIVKQSEGKVFKVLVRGGGVELDDEADTIELNDFGEEEEEKEGGGEGEGEGEGQEAGTSGAFATELARISPAYEKALAENRGDVGRMRSVFAYAQEKAESGEESAALTALKTLQKLLDEAGGATTNGALREEALKGWATARDLVLGKLRILATEISKTDNPSEVKSKALVEIQSVIKNLNFTPTNPADVERLENYVREDDVVKAVEECPDEIATMKIVDPLLLAIADLKKA